MVSVLLQFGILYRNLIEAKSCASVCTCAALSHVSSRDCCSLLIEVRRRTPSSHHIGRLGTYPTQSAAIIVSCSCASREGLESARAKLVRLPNLDLLQKHPCSVCPALRHSHPIPSIYTVPDIHSGRISCGPYLFLYSCPHLLSLLYPYSPHLSLSCPDTSVAKMGINNPLPASMACKSTVPDNPRSRRSCKLWSSPGAGHPGPGTTGCYLAGNKTTDQRKQIG